MVAKKGTKKGAKKERKDSEVPEFKKSKAQEPTEELSTGPAKIKLPMAEERKEVGAALEEKLLDQEIAQLKEIIGTTAEGPSKCDLYFRLAERFYEKARAIYYSEMQDYDKLVEAWMQKRETTPDAPEPKIDNRKSQVYTDQAMNIYGTILKKCAEYPRRDEVLFTMGYNLYESGKKSEGVKMYWELIKGFPESRFIPDAYLAMGEHFFNTNEVFKAKTAYEKALTFSKSKVYTYAQYKLAWCDYNLGDYEAAIDKFKKVVDLAQQESAQTGDKNKIQLRREALQDLVLAFSQIDGLEEAQQYYVGQVGQSGTLDYMRKLARTYEKQGKAEMSVKSFRLLLNEYPNDPECPAFHNAIVLAYQKLNEREKVKQEISRLIDQYKPGSQWAEVNKSNQMAIRKANDLVEGSLRDLVTSYHKEAQETKSWDTYNLARGIYAKYLETFPDAEAAYKLRWYYSDILYKMRDFYAAADQYAMVVRKDPKGEFGSEAAYNSVLCWEKCMEMRDEEKKDCREWKAESGTKKLQKEASKDIRKQDYSFVQKGVTKDMLVEREIPLFEKKFLESADVFSDVARDHEMYIPIRFKSAFIFYQYRHFDEMTKRFGEIIERHPTNEFAMKAVQLSLNALYMRANQEDAPEEQRNKAWADLNHWAKTFKANKVLVSSPAAEQKKFGDELQNLIEESGYNTVLAMRKTDPLQAGTGFDQFVKDYPKSKFAHRAQYAAMVIFDEANQLDLAIAAGKNLLKSYKDSDRINPTVGLLASFHDRIAKFSSAAKYNELTYTNWLEQEGRDKDGKPKEKSKDKSKEKAKEKSKDKSKEKAKAGEKDALNEPVLITDAQASDALYNAALLRESMGDYTTAIKNYTDYVKIFPDNKDTPDLFYRIGKIYERRTKWREADRIFEGYLEKYASRSNPSRMLDVLYKHTMALREQSRAKDAEKLLGKIIDEYNKLDEKTRNADARRAVAHARFLEVEREFDEYIALKLVLPPSVLKKNLFKKIEIRPKLEKKYEEIIGYTDPDWSIASLVRLGQLSQDLADSMIGAPVPGGLSPEQADIYQEELQKEAMPLEEKAVAFFRRAIDVSSQKGIYNEWTLKAQDFLRKAEPHKYPEVYVAAQRSTEFFFTAKPALEPMSVPEEPVEPSSAAATPAQ